MQRLAEASGWIHPLIKADLDKLVRRFRWRSRTRRLQETSRPRHCIRRSSAGWFRWRSGRRRPTHAAWQALRLLSSGLQRRRCAAREWVSLSYEHGVSSASQPGDRRLEARAYDGLCALAAHPEACPDIGDSGAVFAAVRGYAGRHLETGFRSLRVIDQVFDRTQR